MLTPQNDQYDDRRHPARDERQAAHWLPALAPETIASMQSSRMPARTRRGGFTLIELMITVVVIAILAAVAFPSFMGSIRKSRRSEAFTALSAIQQAQERWRSNNSSYNSSLGPAPTGLAVGSPTASGYYTLSVLNATATGYEAVAMAVGGTTQAEDGECVRLGVQLAGGNLSYGSSSGGALTYATTNKCWSR